MRITGIEAMVLADPPEAGGEVTTLIRYRWPSFEEAESWARHVDELGLFALEAAEA